MNLCRTPPSLKYVGGAPGAHPHCPAMLNEFLFPNILLNLNLYRAKLRSLFLTGTLIQGQRKLAIPLCLPNNWEWNPTTGKCTKKGDRRSSLYVVEDAIAQLRQIKGFINDSDIYLIKLKCLMRILQQNKRYTRYFSL